MSKEWKISDSQKQHFTTNLVAGEIQEDQLKDGQTSEHRNRQWCLKEEEGQHILFKNILNLCSSLSYTPT
jgi:hypothetical protein